MVKRRNWEALSPAYRKRIARGGITRAEYESGAKVTAARGHAKTPERPSRATKHPERYSDYSVNKRVKQPTNASEAARLRREVKKIGARYGIPDILDFVKPSERAQYIAGWQIANEEFKRNGQKVSTSNAFGRARLDAVENTYAAAPKEIGFYH